MTGSVPTESPLPGLLSSTIYPGCVFRSSPDTNNGASAMAFEIEGHGWELQVKRLGIQQHPGDKVRTYGAYQVFIDGVPVTTLSGHICEATGPGDNTAHGTDK